MNEALISFIWRFSLFQSFDFVSNSNEIIQIVSPGIPNYDAGPDFFNAKIKIGETLWAGNIEIHVKTSDWTKHNHQYNKAFDSVILHVVFDNDLTEKINEIPVLELKNYINPALLERYDSIIASKQWVPCANMLHTINATLKNHWLERLMVERLERKTKEIENLLVFNNNSWEETFYQLLASNFGFKTNKVPFELLAKSIAQKILAKQKDNLFQIEALLFGQSGLLSNELMDEYPVELLKEYNYLRKKYKLNPIEGYLWKFLRTRPQNFPTIRISQFAQLIHKSSSLFSHVLECNNLNSLQALFNLKASSYWDNHFVFDKIHLQSSAKALGNRSVNILLINAVIPLIFAYGKQRNSEELTARAIDFIYLIESENNSVINKWASYGLVVQNAAESQALIELKTNYCDLKRCLECEIGASLLSSERI